jgi:hypothetical protein
LVEQLICNQPVGGSNPSIGSVLENHGKGEIPERSNGADCKSVGEAFGGSNPPLPTTNLRGNNIFLSEGLLCLCGNSSFGRATAFQAVGGGFEPRFPLNLPM